MRPLGISSSGTAIAHERVRCYMLRLGITDLVVALARSTHVNALVRKKQTRNQTSDISGKRGGE